MSRIATTSGIAHGIVLALAAAVPAIAERPSPRDVGPRLNVQMLPEGPQGLASEATCMILDVTDGTSNTIMIAGRVFVGTANGGVWRAARWSGNGGVIEPPVLLPDLGHGGVAFASHTLPHNDGILLAFAGTVFDDGSQARPAMWAGVGAEVNLVVLPTPGDAGGEALGVGVGDVNGDSVPEIIVSGYFVDPGSGGRQAALWFCDWVDYVRRVALPSIAPDTDSEAMAVSYDAGDQQMGVHASGYSYDAHGNRVAVQWMFDWNHPMVSGLVALPDGFDSAARTETVGANETITIGGAIRSPQSVESPALFESDGGEVTMQLLPTPAGASGGRVNSIIAILIGLIAGGEISGPQGDSAAIWINQGEIPASSRVFDLNRLTSNRPEGIRLSTVNAILPYIEQDNLYRVAGAATDALGRRHGYVGIVGSDHAWGSHAVRR